MNDLECEIRHFLPSDLDNLPALQPAGWEDIVPYFKFYLNESICSPIAATEKGKLAGVANTILTDETGWLAHIIVSEAFRKKGIGEQLTKTLMEDLSNAGCKSQHMIATHLGEGIYKKLGFKRVETYLFFKGPKISNPEKDKNIRPLQVSDWESVIAMDEDISGEVREPMLSLYPFDGWGYFIAGELIGYYLPAIGEGTIIASEVQAGLSLLTLKHSLKTCKTVLPESNRDGINFLIRNGFKETGRANRMILGRELTWKPEFVFSRIGGFYA